MFERKTKKTFCSGKKRKKGEKKDMKNMKAASLSNGPFLTHMCTEAQNFDFHGGKSSFFSIGTSHRRFFCFLRLKKKKMKKMKK